MSLIHENVITEGIPLKKLLTLEIVHEPNEHGKVCLTGEAEIPVMKRFMERETEHAITIKSVMKAKEVVLFLGYITNIRMETKGDYGVVSVELEDSSYLLDIRRQNKTYQNLGKSYGDILRDAYNGAGLVVVNVTDQPIGKFILQMDETNWDFSKRMASRFNVPLFSNLTAEKPLVSLGLPPGKQVAELSPSSIDYTANSGRYRDVTANDMTEGHTAVAQDFSGMCVDSYDYAYLGDIVKVNGTDYYVRSVHARLVDGLMLMTYELTGRNGFVAPFVRNINCAGRVLTAQVKAVKRDTIQAFFFQIDSEYDSSSTTWFPYSTAYSSSDGSGWYVMPEVGDFVRILCPSNHEEEAFAASAVNTSPPASTRNKSFRAPGGKELLLTYDGISMICNHQNIFIDLSQDNGVSIISSQPVHISSDKCVNIEAVESVHITAGKQILLQSGTSHVKLTEKQITFGGESVIVGE